MSRLHIISIGDAPCLRPCHYVGCPYSIDGHCHDNDYCENADGERKNDGGNDSENEEED